MWNQRQKELTEIQFSGASQCQFTKVILDKLNLLSPVGSPNSCGSGIIVTTDGTFSVCERSVFVSMYLMKPPRTFRLQVSGLDNSPYLLDDVKYLFF